MEKINLWEKIGNKCLEWAIQMLDSKTVPTAATVETVNKLVRTAISIDELNLQWEKQTQSVAVAFPD